MCNVAHVTFVHDVFYTWDVTYSMRVTWIVMSHHIELCLQNIKS